MAEFFKDLEEDFNPLLIFFLILVVIANAFLMTKGVFFGLVYTVFFITSVVLVFIVEKLTIGEPQHELVSRFIRAPFGSSMGVGYVLWFLGLLTPLAVQFIGKIFKSGFSVVSFSIPLFANKISEGVTQAFAVVAVEESMPWQIFNFMFNAGTTEEWIFDYALIFVFVVFFIKMANQFSQGSTLNKLLKNKFIVLFLAVVIVTLLFAGAHNLSETYEDIGDYVFAGSFKFLSIITIYYFGVLMIYWIGYHMMSNLLYLVHIYGIGEVVNGFASWFGILFGVIVVFGFGYVVFRLPTIIVEFKDYFSKMLTYLLEG